MSEENKERRIKIGKTTYFIRTNYVPNKQNKAALLKAIQYLMEHAEKPDK